MQIFKIKGKVIVGFLCAISCMFLVSGCGVVAEKYVVENTVAGICIVKYSGEEKN